MLVAEQIGTFDDGVSHRRHGRRRSRRSRFLRKVRRNWRRTRWRNTVVSLILATGAIVAGYWAAMYVTNQDVPSPEELGVEQRGK
jgi:hypothetical protein